METEKQDFGNTNVFAKCETLCVLPVRLNLCSLARGANLCHNGTLAMEALSIRPLARAHRTKKKTISTTKNASNQYFGRSPFGLILWSRADYTDPPEWPGEIQVKQKHRSSNKSTDIPINKRADKGQCLYDSKCQQKFEHISDEDWDSVDDLQKNTGDAGQFGRHPAVRRDAQRSQGRHVRGETLRQYVQRLEQQFSQAALHCAKAHARRRSRVRSGVAESASSHLRISARALRKVDLTSLPVT